MTQEPGKKGNQPSVPMVKRRNFVIVVVGLVILAIILFFIGLLFFGPKTTVLAVIVPIDPNDVGVFHIENRSVVGAKVHYFAVGVPLPTDFVPPRVDYGTETSSPLMKQAFGSPTVEIICTPPSGSEFPLGTTNVQCDTVVNGVTVASGTFPVTLERDEDILRSTYLFTGTFAQTVGGAPWLRVGDNVVPGSIERNGVNVNMRAAHLSSEYIDGQVKFYNSSYSTASGDDNAITDAWNLVVSDSVITPTSSELLQVKCDDLTIVAGDNDICNNASFLLRSSVGENGSILLDYNAPGDGRVKQEVIVEHPGEFRVNERLTMPHVDNILIDGNVFTLDSDENIEAAET
ncbi:MAG: hypothetical protein ACRD5H_14395, partial [Nitrososphaerales archaeon]